MMPSRRMLTTLLFGMLGCSTESPPIDLFTIQGVVAGSVVTSAQTPVAGAMISATAQYPLPSGPLPLNATTLSDSAGRFRLVFTLGNLRDTLVPVMMHTTAAGYASRDTAGLFVRITRFVPPAETTHVVVTLVP